MQRLFSAFPAGLPGAGLFLLRVSLAVGLVLRMGGRLDPAARSAWEMQALSVLVLAAGVALVLGFLTPVAALLALACDGAMVLLSSGTVAAGLHSGGLSLAADAVAVALIGPGWLSIDSRLFGRRVIQIERR